MPDVLQQFYSSITTKNWFASAALAILIAMQLLKNLPLLRTKIWVKIPVGYRFLLPIVGAMATAFVHGYLVHETLGADLWDVVKIAFTSMGAAAALKESPLPWDGGKGGAPLAPAPTPGPVVALAPAIPDLEDDDKTPVDGSKVPPPSEPPIPPPAA